MPIPPVEVKITANGTQAEASVRRTSRVIRKQFQQVDLQTKKLVASTDLLANGFLRVGRNVAAFAGIGFGVAAIRQVTTSIRESADELNKFSKRLGVNVEAVQKLRFISGQVGVKEAEFDRSLDRFVKRIGEATEGRGEAAPAFQSLGIDIFEDIDGKAQVRKATDLLQELAIKFQDIQDPAIKASIAAKLFGREGIKMVNVLNLGPEGIALLGQELESFGAVLDKDLLANAETLTDELDRLSRVVDFRLTKFFLELAPAIEAVAREIREYAQEGGFESLTEAITTFGQLLVSLSIANKIVAVALALNQYRVAQTAAAASSGVLVAGSGLATAALARQQLATAALTVGTRALGAALKGVLIGGAVYLAVEAGLKLVKSATDELKEATKKANEERERELQNLKKNSAEYRAYEADIQSSLKSLKANSEELKAIDDLIKKITKEVAKFSVSQTRVLQAEYQKQKAILNDQKKIYKDVADELINLQKSFDDVLKKIETAPTGGEVSFGSVGDSIAGARKNLVDGNQKDALAQAEAARDQIEELVDKTSSQLDRLALKGLLKQAREIAVEAQKGVGEQKIADAELAADEAVQNIQRIKSALEELSKEVKINITNDEDSLDTARQQQGDLIKELNDAAVVQIKYRGAGGVDREGNAPERTSSGGRNRTQADDTPAFATGGFVSGPGTRTSDSIHARLSNGEYVMKADAVSRYGLGLMNQINNMKLPKFKEGGPVGRAVNLNIGDHSFPMQAQTSVVEDLQRHVRMQALSKGRRT